MRVTKEEVIRKYREYKDKHQALPKFRAFVEYAGIPRNLLAELFGRDAFSKLQQECGDKANKLNLKRIPLEVIMKQYGDLALQLNELPRSSDWAHHKLKPSLAGLWKAPHSISWKEFPRKFQEWVTSEGITGYEKVLSLIDGSAKPSLKTEKRDPEFEKLCFDIRSWSPARRRNSEGEYKVELRGHLKSLGYLVNEEFGESTVDLLINKKHMVELKKDPKLGDYDRLFGQLARHLQHQLRVIALIFDAASEDHLRNFEVLADTYLNREAEIIEVIKK
jgi:hypothetical protein